MMAFIPQTGYATAVVNFTNDLSSWKAGDFEIEDERYSERVSSNLMSDML